MKVNKRTARVHKKKRDKSVRVDVTKLVNDTDCQHKEIAIIQKNGNIIYVFTPLKYEDQDTKIKRIKQYEDSQRPPGYNDING